MIFYIYIYIFGYELREKPQAQNFIFTNLQCYFSKALTKTLFTATVTTPRVRLSAVRLSFTLEFLRPYVLTASLKILM